MRVLRFLRPARSSATAVETAGPVEALGLDAFATEAPPPRAAVVQPDVNVERLVLALIVVSAVAVLEAVPALLWIQNRFSAPERVVSAAAAPVSPSAPPAESMAEAAPCVPTVSAQAASGAAATTGEVEKAPVARAAALGLVAGLLAVDAPVPMHVYAEGKLVGTTEADTIMLPVGSHDVEFVSDAVGVRMKRTVSVQAGRTTSVSLEAPKVPVHINAVPWAEVWIDNQHVGETPIGNLQQSVGSHEVVFRHPELGERRMVVVVTMKEPARISMDLRKR